MLAALLAFAACKHDAIVEEPDRLKTVTVLGSEVVLPREGNGEMTFRIRDDGAVFNYDVSSPDCQVRLRLASGGESENFRLAGVHPNGEPGLYTAVIADNGEVDEYSEKVCITIVQHGAGGSESYIASGYFNVRNEAAGYSVIIKTGLPVVYIDTENGRPVNSKTTEVPGILQIKGEGGYKGHAAVNCTIRGRGNTTWQWPKKPYLVKLENRTSLLGMPEHKRWVLLANFMDRTLMRNLVSMKVASMTSLDWTPRCVPVELVLNGKHVGSYLLIEQVRVDENRVNISEEEGFLLESDFHYDNKVQWIDYHGSSAVAGGGIPFGIKNPDPDVVTSAQKAYIKQYISDTANALWSSDFADPEKGYAAWIDVDSFIDYWIVFEVMGNHELGNPGSVFFHKDVGGKLVAGPCWDFDWGVLSYNTSPHARTGLVNRNAHWYRRLFDDPAFRSRVRVRFKELRPQFETIPAYMDECEKLLTESATLNFSMWNPAEDASMNGGRIINGDENMSFHDAVARLKNNFQERLDVIEKNL